MGGYGNGIFGPDRNTTRQALWMVLARLNGSNPADMAAARSWAVANGIMGGTSDGRLNPAGTASRAHFAVFMYRFCNLYNIA